LRTRTLAIVALCLTAGVVASLGDASAQWWPWGKDQDPPIPREPMRQPPSGQPPSGQPPSGQPPPPNQPPSNQLPPLQPGKQPPWRQPPGQFDRPPPPQGPSAFGPRGPNSICQQLERRFVEVTSGSGRGRELLPKIDADMRELERTHRTASIRLQRSDCFDQFLFMKTLRKDRLCIQLNDEVESTQRRLADLERQKKLILGSGDRTMQDEIIRELARNSCGPQYEQEARKRDSASNPFAMLFGGGEDTDRRGPANQFGNLPFATYRTLCVRLCDGYYFPVSFSTLPNHFERDAQVCQSQCAAPAELYFHQNPGGSVEQMMSFGSQQPYTSLKTAFRYRKEFVNGCSCKQAEFNPELMEKGAERKKAEVPAPKETPPASGVKIGAKR
jgi:hypothetical protein